MQIAGLSCPTRHGLADPAYLEERVQLIRSGMELARPLHTSHLIVPCGLIPDSAADRALVEADSADPAQHDNPFSFASGPSQNSKSATQEDQFATLVEVLTDLVRYGNHVGCILTLQLANYQVSLVQQLLAAVTDGPLQIVLDPAVAVFTGANIIETYRQLYGHVGFVRARDGIRNADDSGTETAGRRRDCGLGRTPADAHRSRLQRSGCVWNARAVSSGMPTCCRGSCASNLCFRRTARGRM